MKIDIGSFMFNTEVRTAGATPSWGTALGQGEGYKFKEENTSIVSSMVYNSIKDIENVTLDLGKGGNGIATGQYEIVIASKFNKVYFNNEKINDASFILVIVKENTGYHTGRRTLKYNPYIKYNDEELNLDCIKKIREQFNIADNGSFVVYEINVINQDELHLSAVVLDSEKKKEFNDVNDRKEYIEMFISDKISKENIMSYKQGFVNYMQNEDKKDITCKTYVRCLQEISQELYKNDDGIFYENDIRKLKELHDDEFSKYKKINGYYKENTKKQHKSAMKKYIAFLEESNFNPTNLVIYGTPGCGKSYELDRRIREEYEIDEKLIVRTTFYHDYTNADFIGQVNPVVRNDGSAEYCIVPGPFTKALLYAYNNQDKKVALIIEELNRGDAPSIFGDIFQLLDREKDASNNMKLGVSKYQIYNRLIQDYLNNNTEYYFASVRIPANLYIFATMNTSDQNVFTLDTAFKRRWDFEKMTNNYDGFDKELYVPGMMISWIDFVKKINKSMRTIDGHINEDKQLGLYFVDSGLLVTKDESFDINKTKKFAYKLLEYLWDDVVRFNHDSLFDSKIETLDDLITKYVEYAEKNESDKVFVDGIFANGEEE